MTSDIKKILDEIDWLAKSVTRDGKGSKEYTEALVINFPTLRDYIARLERKSEAGKTAIAFLEGSRIIYYPVSGENPSDTARAVMKKFENLHAEIISAYRSACEGEEK